MTFPTLELLKGKIKGKTAFQGVNVNTNTPQPPSRLKLTLLLLISSPRFFVDRGGGYSPSPSAPSTPPCKYAAHTPAWAPNSTRLPHNTHTQTSTHTHTSYTSEEQGVASLIFMESVVLSSFIMWFLASISSSRGSLCFHPTVERTLWKTLEILQNIKSGAFPSAGLELEINL